MSVAVRQRIAAAMTVNRKGALMILGGSAGGQLLIIISAPLLTQIYTPAEFGTFTLIAGFILPVAAVAALRFEAAIPLPESDGDAYGLVALGFYSICGTCLSVSLVVLIFGQEVAEVFHQPAMLPILWFVPITAGAMATFNILNQLAIRHRRYGAIGKRNLLQQAATILIQLAAGVRGWQSAGLIVGMGMGQLAGAFSLLPRSGLRSKEACKGRGLSRVKAMVHRYRRFPLVLAPSALLNVLGLQIPVILIAYFYGDVVAGWLGLTQRVLALPIALLGTAIAQVYLGELSRMARAKVSQSYPLFVRTSKRLLFLAVSVSGFVAIASPWLFSAIFGPSWAPAGEYAQALALGLAAQLVASPLSPTLIVYERQVTQLIWDFFRLAATAAAVVICALGGFSPLTAVWSVSIVSTVAYLTSWLLSWQTVRRGP